MTDAVSRFTGFAELYDRARPRPPREIVAVVRQWIGVDAPDVVDLGAGTGTSSALWQGVASSITAVEPSADMRAVAERRFAGTDVRLVGGTAEATGLPDACADVVTASQALHWFDPETVFPEIKRLLRPGGVFAAYDCDWPPGVDAEVDAAYREFERVHRALDGSAGLRPAYAEKVGHVDRLRASFAHVAEICLHHEESGDVTRLMEIAGSQGGVVALQRAGHSDEEIGLAALREVAERRLATAKPWWWTYRVRLATTRRSPSR
ncbi:class I SAM-dependent methyltransferase [Lentzea tibetensis]|uniref:Class I SAM-dependent methyltransferase n=1 Tax=Lentzea tibetensis TaxID=2591470 RepID=A0A563EWN5_9PSEU|nr:class I SAM-dependent methyltransferase [Lentzea tibetensis]TWP52116.1 class I SAM-dependent methyltransferase [Lentzea tibetensis]